MNSLKIQSNDWIRGGQNEFALSPDPIARRGDGFALAERAAAGGGEPLPLLEDKPAIKAGGRVHGELPGMDRTGDVLKVVEGFLFADAQDLGDLAKVQGASFQEFGDFFADRGHIF